MLKVIFTRYIAMVCEEQFEIPVPASSLTSALPCPAGMVLVLEISVGLESNTTKNITQKMFYKTVEEL